ncbi:MAG: hypothetical protein U1G07_16840 [Verrucomicrobiota bacterium]
MRKAWTLSTLLTVLGMFAVGCASPSKPWNVQINKTTPATIETDLIGVTKLDRARWENTDLDQYWAAGSQVRRDSDKLSNTVQMNQPWVITRDDPKWRSWLDRGATDLLIIANLPGKHPSGPADPRRIFLPLQGSAWKAKDDALQIELRDSEIRVMTPQKQRK